MATSHHKPVVISGAGPVGLALALGLQRRGVKTIVLEKKAEFDTHSRAVLVVPHTLQVFHDLGILQNFLDQGKRDDAVSLLRAPDRKLLFRFGFDSLKAVTPTPYSMAISQDRTNRILNDAAQAAGVDIRMGDGFEHFENTEDGVRVHHSKGEPIEAAVLAGCDGAHSGVRGQLKWDLEGKTYDGRALLVDVRIDPAADTEAGWITDPTHESFLFTLRFADGVWRIVESSITDDVDDADLPERARKLAGQLFGPTAWRETLWTSAYRKHERRSLRFVDGRVVIAGDAAHLNSPAGGQGLNAGIGDAARLAGAIATGLASEEDGGLEGALGAYEHDRITFFDEHVKPLTSALEFMETASPMTRRLIVGTAEFARHFGFERYFAKQLSMLTAHS